MRDPRKDPRPGDVVRFPGKWDRKVLANDGERITYVALTPQSDCVHYEVTLGSWHDASDIAEVIYANEG